MKAEELNFKEAKELALILVGEEANVKSNLAACYLDLLAKFEALEKAARAFQAHTHWGMSEWELEYSDKLNAALAALDRARNEL